MPEFRASVASVAAMRESRLQPPPAPHRGDSGPPRAA